MASGASAEPAPPPTVEAGSRVGGPADDNPPADLPPGPAARAPDLLRAALLESDPSPVDRPAVDTGILARQQLRALLLDRPLRVQDLRDPGERAHDPSRRLAEFVRLRDPLCTGPGCSASSHRSDLDHLTPWPTGPTTAGNLQPKSRRCHRAKTFSWRVTHDPDGSTHWHSPTGRTYDVPPYWTPPPIPRRTVLRGCPPATSTLSGWGSAVSDRGSAVTTDSPDTALTALLDAGTAAQLDAETHHLPGTALPRVDLALPLTPETLPF